MRNSTWLLQDQRPDRGAAYSTLGRISAARLWSPIVHIAFIRNTCFTFPSTVETAHSKALCWDGLCAGSVQLAVVVPCPVKHQTNNRDRLLDS